jgi:hypothetical protein
VRTVTTVRNDFVYQWQRRKEKKERPVSLADGPVFEEQSSKFRAVHFAGTGNVCQAGFFANCLSLTAEMESSLF